LGRRTEIVQYVEGIKMIICKSKPLASLIIAGFFISGTLPFMANAQSKVGTYGFTDEVNSARAVGMGSCAINLVSPESPLHNPAALGLFHLDHLASVNFPDGTRLGSELGNNDYSLESRGVSGGISYKFLRPTESTPIDFSIGLAFSRHRLDYGLSEVTYPSTNGSGNTHLNQTTDYFSVGFGVDIHGLLHVGFGYSRRNLEISMQPAFAFGRGKLKGNTNDYGLIAQLRIHELAWRKPNPDQLNLNRIHFELTPSYAVVKTNVGGSMSYENEPGSFPFSGREVTNTGPAIFAAINKNEARLLTVFWTLETNNDYVSNSHGMEFGIADILFYRIGKSRKLGNVEIDTKGFGVSLGGIMAWLDEWGKLDTENNGFHRLIRKLDVRYDYAEREGLDKFYKLTLALLQ
jgi:hypothetical protein